MFKISDNDILRNGQKAGWIEGNDIRTKENFKAGYFEGDHVYDSEGHKVAYIEGNYLFSTTSSAKISLDEINKNVQGGMLPEIGRCAIYMLLGG